MRTRMAKRQNSWFRGGTESGSVSLCKIRRGARETRIDLNDAGRLTGDHTDESEDQDVCQCRESDARASMRKP